MRTWRISMRRTAACASYNSEHGWLPRALLLGKALRGGDHPSLQLQEPADFGDLDVGKTAAIST